MTDNFSPRLLVSVRNATEAQAALDGGCDILDIKEPGQGSLGMADVETMTDVIRAVRQESLDNRTISITAALGETLDWIDSVDIPQLPTELEYVKLGLSEMNGFSDWVTQWKTVRIRFEERAGSAFCWIAVIYIDREAARSLEPDAIVDAAVETGCAGVLFDTFQKDGQTLLDWLTAGDLQRLVERIHGSQLKSAVAGSLRIEMLPEVLCVHPDIVAIRGAACCDANRTSVIDSQRVRAFKSAMQVESRSVSVRSGATRPGSM